MNPNRRFLLERELPKKAQRFLFEDTPSGENFRRAFGASSHVLILDLDPPKVAHQSWILNMTYDLATLQQINAHIKYLERCTISQVFYYMRLLFVKIDTLIGSPSVSLLQEMKKCYDQMLSIFFFKALDYNTGTVDFYLRHLLPNVHVDLRYSYRGSEVLEEYGAFLNESSLFMKPMTFVKLRQDPVKTVPFRPIPSEVYSVTDMGMVAFPDGDDDICVTIGNSSAVISNLKLLMSINPRLPENLFTKCHTALPGLYVAEKNVDFNLYLDFMKVGMPIHAYVNINQINTALERGDKHWVLTPTLGANGRPLIQPVAMASVVGVSGINMMSRSHCEKGHVGDFYDLYVVSPRGESVHDLVREGGLKRKSKRRRRARRRTAKV
jgi:hypothetical protein